MKAQKVKPDDLIVNPNDNPRKILFTSEEAEEIFVDQMKRAGPSHVEWLEVFEINNKSYKLHSGYRRLHAAKRLKWDHVPCRVLTTLTDKDAFIRAVATNYHRENLDGYSLVMAIIKLQEDHKLTQDDIAKALGLSQQYVSFLLTVSKYPELLNYLKIGGHISKAISLSQITKEIDRIAILGSIDSYSTAQLREIVKDAKHIEVIKPPLESIAEPLDEREASDEGHPSEKGSIEHPIPIDAAEDDGEVGQPGISPEGEGTTSVPPSPTKPGEGSDSLGGSLSGEEGGSTEPETPPPEPPEVKEPKSDGWKKGHYHPCGTFFPDGTEHIVKKRNEHTCKDVLSVGLNVNHKILEMIERKETVDIKNGSISRTDWHISDSYGPFQVDDGRLEESIKTWNQNKLVTGHVVRALENVKQKRDNDETERLKKLGEEPLIVVS